MLSKKFSLLFILITILFVTSLLTANIISVKIISLMDIFVPAGIIVFPLSYILGDVLTEVYGYNNAKIVIWLAFLANLLMVVFIFIALNLPSAPFWNDQSSFINILGFTPRLLLASFAAFLVGSFSNSIVLSKMKILTKGKMLWSRTIGSTVVGEGLDSLIFVSIAFIGIFTTEHILSLILSLWLIKSLYEIISTPFTYAVIGYLKKNENLDSFDYKISYNPFKGFLKNKK